MGQRRRQTSSRPACGVRRSPPRRGGPPCCRRTRGWSRPANRWPSPTSGAISTSRTTRSSAAGLVSELAATIGGWLPDPHIAYVASRPRHATPLARGFRIVDELPYREKPLKAALQVRRGRHADGQEARRRHRARGADPPAQAQGTQHRDGDHDAGARRWPGISRRTPLSLQMWMPMDQGWQPRVELHPNLGIGSRYPDRSQRGSRQVVAPMGVRRGHRAARSRHERQRVLRSLCRRCGSHAGDLRGRGRPGRLDRRSGRLSGPGELRPDLLRPARRSSSPASC